MYVRALLFWTPRALDTRDDTRDTVVRTSHRRPGRQYQTFCYLRTLGNKPHSGFTVENDNALSGPVALTSFSTPTADGAAGLPLICQRRPVFVLSTGSGAVMGMVSATGTLYTRDVAASKKVLWKVVAAMVAVGAL